MTPVLAHEASKGGHPLSHFAIAAAIGIVAFVVIKVKERQGRQPHHQNDDPIGPLPPHYLLHVLAVASFSSAALHAAVSPAHVREATIFGAFFVGSALLQAAWAVLVVTRPSRVLLTAGAGANAAIVLVWLLSRTTGLPVGPETWEPEAITVLDALTTAIEVVIVAASSWMLVRTHAHHSHLASA